MSRDSGEDSGRRRALNGIFRRCALFVWALALAAPGCTGEVGGVSPQYLAPGSASATTGTAGATGVATTSVTTGADGCQPGQARCGGVCVGIASNAEHCGACDTPCAEPRTCREGTAGAVRGPTSAAARASTWRRIRPTAARAARLARRCRPALAAIARAASACSPATARAFRSPPMSTTAARAA